MVNHTDANNTTINNNTLNNVASHSQGIEKQMNPKKIPKGFYQQTYHHERKTRHQILLHQLNQKLGIKHKEQNKLHGHRLRKKFNPRYQQQEPTI